MEGILMRTLKLTTFTLLGMSAIIGLAQAQSSTMNGPTPAMDMPSSSPGVYPSTHEPRSTSASNILPDDARSTIAPQLPTPTVGDDADARDYLRAARAALNAGRTGQAQQSLEMAETRLLTREVPPDAATMPDDSPRVNRVRDALHALGEGDRGRALSIIDAMAD
jgi:hypothetical protein